MQNDFVLFLKNLLGLPANAFNAPIFKLTGLGFPCHLTIKRMATQMDNMKLAGYWQTFVEVARS
jgi:hypothetical protein